VLREERALLDCEKKRAHDLPSQNQSWGGRFEPGPFLLYRSAGPKK